MKTRGGFSKAKVAVLAVIVAALVFGLYIGYLAYANDSFPSQQRPFGDYASVVSSAFNGTEYAFTIRWSNGSYLPEKAQLVSASTDAANTPVCWTGLSSIESGQSVFMPFTITPTTITLTNVQLWIAVNQVSGGNEFTIVYTVPSVTAGNSTITPSNFSCQENGAEIE